MAIGLHHEDMDARNAITEQLDAASIGTFGGAGGGMGSMDFSYSVADGDSARAKIESIIAAVLPGREYRINVSDN